LFNLNEGIDHMFLQCTVKTYDLYLHLGDAFFVSITILCVESLGYLFPRWLK